MFNWQRSCFSDYKLTKNTFISTVENIVAYTLDNFRVSNEVKAKNHTHAGKVFYENYMIIILLRDGYYVKITTKTYVFIKLIL